MSILLRPTVPVERLSTLSLVAGVAVAEAIERFGFSPKLKWPNDVWLNGRKVAGILVHSRVGPAESTAILGIGINVNVDLGDLPPGATSLSAVVGRTVPRDQLLQAVLLCLDNAYRQFCETQGQPALDGWTSRAALIGEQVVVSNGPTEHAGETLGIDTDGALLIRGPGNDVVRIIAGDLTRGPRSISAND
jgi:BirA family biotin operon repressor/biotin-[acetyl-CoA-carboxylase] ligase